MSRASVKTRSSPGRVIGRRSNSTPMQLEKGVIEFVAPEATVWAHSSGICNGSIAWLVPAKGNFPTQGGGRLHNPIISQFDTEYMPNIGPSLNARC